MSLEVRWAGWYTKNGIFLKAWSICMPCGKLNIFLNLVEAGMDFLNLKRQLGRENEVLSLDEMRQHLLDLLLLSSVVLGTGIYIFALGPAISNNLYPFVAVYSVSYVWLLVITFVRRLPYRLRANSWLLFLYLFGTLNLPLSGFNVDSGLFLLTFIAMSTLLYNSKAGLVALALSLASVGIMAYFIVYQGFHLYLGLPQNNGMLWVIGGAIFVLMGTILIVSVTVLLQDMALNLVRTTTLAEEMRHKNEELIESERRYRRLVETSPDAILLVSLDGKIMMANLASQVLLGFTSAEEMIGWDIKDLAPGDPLGGKGTLENLLTGRVIREVETEMLRKDGRHIMVEFSVSPIASPTGEPLAILGVGRDVTKRKIAEWLLRKAKSKLEQRTEELQASQTQLRKLAAQVITVHEEERRVISQELHDDAGQALITLQYGLSSALEELPAGSEMVRDRLLGALRMVERTMMLIRSVSHRLRPPALEVGGLNLSLAELCRECCQQTGLQIKYKGQELPGLPEDLAINLYRVAQEAITNILKHAGASQVEVALARRRGAICLSILDNGKGSRADIHAQFGIGLFGMHERLSMLGGELRVEANPGEGYRLTARVPWKAPRRKTPSRKKAG